MRNYDFAPLYRSTVGFDRLFDMLDQANRAEPMNWPPYNIEKISEDEYGISMAVAGFAPEDIELTQHGNTLFVIGHRKGSDEDKQYLYRGIATRAFKQTFNIADHVKVTAAVIDNGLLRISLKREIPEALKPRRIQIATGDQTSPAQDNAVQIEHEPQKAERAA